MSPPPGNTIPILFTSVGRRVELVRIFQQAYRSTGLESAIVATDVDPLAPALQDVDHRYLAPRLDDPTYIPTLVEICREHGVKAVFPLIDPDIGILADYREQIEETGAVVATVPASMVPVITDKWETRDFFRDLGLPTPHSWLPQDIDADAMTYPLFIKPRHGSAGKDAFTVRNAHEMRFFLGYVQDPIVQELLPGPEITCDVVCDAAGEVLAVVARRRIEVRWGEVSKGVTLHDQTIQEACCRIALSLQTRGPITVQCMMKEGRPHFTEINARFGGGFPLGVAAGADSAAWLLCRMAGMPHAIPPLDAYRAGVYLTRFDDSYFLDERQYEQMDGHSLRPR